MSDSIFRTRGISVLIDTTESAELDIAGYQVPNSIVELIGANLRSVPISPLDRMAGIVRVRELQGYDIAFLISREDDAIIVTIGALRMPDPTEPLEEKLKRLGVVATFRGAIGI